MDKSIENQSIIEKRIKTIKEWGVANLLNKYAFRKFDNAQTDSNYFPCAYYDIIEIGSNQNCAFVIANTVYKIWNDDMRKYEYNVIFNQTIPLTSSSFGDIIDKRVYNRELKRWKNAEEYKMEELYTKLYNRKPKKS